MKKQFIREHIPRIVFVIILFILGLIMTIFNTGVPPVIAANDLNTYIPKNPEFVIPNPTPTPRPHLLWQYSSVVALNPEPCGSQDHGLIFFGNDYISVRFGDALSYGCIRARGSPTVVTFPSGNRILYSGSLDPGNGIFDPAPEWMRDLIQVNVDFTEQAQDACDLLPNLKVSKGNNSTDAIISPGNYSTIIVTDTLTMLPGLYCLYGDFIVNGGASVTGDGITIYMTNGNFMPNNNAIVHIKAPPGGILPDPIWTDLLIYVANYHTAEISLSGNPLSFYRGVIFAPASNINIENGYNDKSYFTQLIGWNVSIGGTSGIFIDPNFWP
jgi:hypothetical protein